MPGVPDVTSRYDRADTVPEVAAGLNACAAHIEGFSGASQGALEGPAGPQAGVGGRRCGPAIVISMSPEGWEAEKATIDAWLKP